MPLWGLKTVAMFDVWTFEHILTGISVGTAVKKRNHRVLKNLLGFDHDRHAPPLHFDLIGVLFVAFLWEAIEHYLEIGLAGQTVEYWFQGVELWSNRLLSDPAMLVVGYFIAKRFRFLIIPARVLSVLWLVTHIFIFPHSMYLQELL